MFNQGRTNVLGEYHSDQPSRATVDLKEKLNKEFGSSQDNLYNTFL